MKQNEQGTQVLAAAGWSAASFRIRTADGWLEVDGIVRPPFGIDQRAADGTGNRSWFVTHLPSGRAVVPRVKVLAVGVALADRIAALTDWDARDISATPDLRAHVREALDRSYGDFFADRLPALPEDASPAARARRAVHISGAAGAPTTAATVPPRRSPGATKA